MGDMSKERAFEMLDFFYAQGGNFIDTSNNYQSEQSETWIGEWLAAHPDLREQMVIATKYTTSFTAHRGFENGAHPNTSGNGIKSMRVSVDASLRKLQVSYIDILYVHWWDFTTSIPELMLGLNTLIQQGKVLYLGISDAPAWVVSKANEYARGRGLQPFVVYQGRWNAAERDFEREILGMCAAEGMGLAPWGVLGAGSFKTEQQREEARRTKEGRQSGEPSERYVKVSAVLEKIADAKGTALTSVALAYVMHKAPYVFPIVGGRTIEHLQGNIEALGLELTKDEIAEIEGAVEFDVGFPLNFVGDNPGGVKGPGDIWVAKIGCMTDYVENSLVSATPPPSPFLIFLRVFDTLHIAPCPDFICSRYDTNLI
jgi:aryl-alcohol dehydrogenase-like predicted oxidoreductase